MVSPYGFRLRRARRGGHWHVVNEAGRLVAVVAATPRSKRWKRTVEADLRRAAA